MSTARLPAPARRQQLLEVALPLFAQRGFHDTAMGDIALAAGVTKPVLYQHFPSKQALFRQLLRALGDDLRQEVASATGEATTPHGQVAAGFAAWFRWVARRPVAFDLLFSGDARRDPELAAEVAAVEEELAGTVAALIVVDGLPDDRRRLLAHGIVGVAEATCRHWRGAGADLDPDALAAQVADLVWGGLRGLHS